MKAKSESEVAQSCPTLSDPMDCSLPGSSVHGIFQARVLVPGASTGVPTHNKVMRESSDGQGESELEGAPPDLPECLPQNQNLSVLLFYDFY